MAYTVHRKNRFSFWASRETTLANIPRDLQNHDYHGMFNIGTATLLTGPGGAPPQDSAFPKTTSYLIGGAQFGVMARGF